MAELRLEVLLEAERTGMSVTEVCRRYGISRQTYYRYRRRYLVSHISPEHCDTCLRNDPSPISPD